MGNKYKLAISILQILAGVLAAILFARTIMYGGKIESTLVSLIVMILGMTNGVRGIRDMKKH